MHKTNILIICGTLGSGGAERVISHLSRPFSQNFDNVTILMWRKAPVFYKIDSSVNLIYLDDLAKSNNLIKKGFYFRSFIKNNKYDLIVSFLTPINMLTLTFTIGLKLPVIVAERIDPRCIPGGKFMSSIRSLLYHRAKYILCQTESIKKFFNKSLNYKCKVIYNPVFMSKDMIGAALQTDKKDRIVSIGRLHPQKNQSLLIESFALFSKKHPSYTLSIYGKGCLEGYLIKKIQKLDLVGKVILEGEKQNVIEEIMNAKVFILTSDFEGMPNALIEAMCIGLPCISTKVSGAVDLIRDGENGILVERQPDIIANKISQLINNSAYSSMISKEAAKLYEVLDINRISNEWISFFKNVLK